MDQRFEDNLIKAITTSDVQLLKSTLDRSEKFISWNQTVDGLSVLALCVKFFHSEIVNTLYPPLNRTFPLPSDMFPYVIEHAPKAVVDFFAVNIIAAINDKLTENDLWVDDNDAERILKILRKSTPHINALVNDSSCNLIGDLLKSKIQPEYVSLLLIKAIEWDNTQLLDHAIEHIEQKDANNWEYLAYKDWTADHVQHIFSAYSAQSFPNLNKFLNKISDQAWHTLQKAQHQVMLYSSEVLKDVLKNGCTDDSKNYMQNAPQYVLQRLSDEDVLKTLTSQELEVLSKWGAGGVIEKYEFLSKTPLRFEVPLILEQHRRIYFNKKDIKINQTEDAERQKFQVLCTPLLSSEPYAFLEKRMDLELYYKSIHEASPNQSVSVLDCLKAQERAWVEKCLLHQHLAGTPTLMKKSKI